MRFPTTAADRRAALALVQAILPQSGRIPGGDERTVEALLDALGDASAAAPRALGLAAQALDRAATAYCGRRLVHLDEAGRERLLQRWLGDPLLGGPLSLLSLALKGVHFDRASVCESMGCPQIPGGAPEPAPWLAQVRPGDEADETTECDVVVVGTGAGGAVAGEALARRGLAVVFVEEGRLHRRDEFGGGALDAKRRFYRGNAGICAIGNAVIPTFMGCMVGGSTTINAATCFRTPDRVLRRWCEKLESDAFAPEAFRPHLDRIEQVLQVEEARPGLRGGLARVLARGCDTLGWRHGVVRRNAPACDARGHCDLGCPSGAKRSTDVAFLPSALRRGAVVFTGTRAERVWLERGRAVGVGARTTGGRAVRVRARATVLAGGAVPTPALLLRQGLCGSSGRLGAGLSLHPMGYVSALFDERIAGHEAIPQSCFSDEFLDQGLLLLGSSAPAGGAGLVLPFSGRPLMQAVERFDQVATLAVLVEDDARGRVRLVAGRPLLTYRMSRHDVARMQRGMALCGEIFRAAGARSLYPMLLRPPELDAATGPEQLRAMRLRARDFVLTSFHPLGTCPMGRDRRRSVIGLDHQAHDVPGLFVADGSAVPGPPGVNPQITIMAMADRAAGCVARALGEERADM